MKLPWFRLYAEAIDDEKLRLLAFEDRWHFIALMCCMGQGILDSPPDSLSQSFQIVQLRTESAAQLCRDCLGTFQRL